MKTHEEIEKLADDKYLERAEAINDSTLRGIVVSSVKGGFVDGYIQCQEDNNPSKVTRVEVVDESGRVYSQWDCSVELSYQDDNRTLKVFVKPLNK